ncbi:hypothetical protein [Thioalkalivibrio sp. ALE23]|uniref:hypothetical protein n=1 Tax=Thioalkalivibrio sp. ALE23 TaxID=1265495 RepID=UPI0003672D7A|nr:hypothetical protein [Thioalkalivibrio sp. ALE23]
MTTIHMITTAERSIPMRLLNPVVDRTILERIGWRIKTERDQVWLYREGHEMTDVVLDMTDAKGLLEALWEFYPHDEGFYPVWVEELEIKLDEAIRFMRENDRKLASVFFPSSEEIFQTAMSKVQNCGEDRLDELPLKTVKITYSWGFPVLEQCRCSMTVVTRNGSRGIEDTDVLHFMAGGGVMSTVAPQETRSAEAPAN